MNPNSNQVLFTVTIESIDLIESLNDFRHISQIEHIMTFCRNWKEILRNSFVYIDSCNGQWFRKGFNFFVEFREFVRKNGLKYSL